MFPVAPTHLAPHVVATAKHSLQIHSELLETIVAIHGQQILLELRGGAMAALGVPTHLERLGIIVVTHGVPIHSEQLEVAMERHAQLIRLALHVVANTGPALQSNR